MIKLLFYGLYILNICLCFMNLLIWLHQVLIEAYGISDLHCSIRDLQLHHLGSSSLTRDLIRVPCIGSMDSQPLDHRELPRYLILIKEGP